MKKIFNKLSERALDLHKDFESQVRIMEQAGMEDTLTFAMMKLRSEWHKFWYKAYKI